MGQRLRSGLFKSAAAVHLPIDVRSNPTAHESGSLKVMDDK